MSKYFPAHDPYTAHDHHYANPRPTPSTARDPLKDPPGETEMEVVEEKIDDGDDDTDQIDDTDDQQGDQDDQDDQDDQGEQTDEDEEEELAAPAPNMTGVIAK